MEAEERNTSGICYAKLFYTEFVAKLLNREIVKFITPDASIPSTTKKRIDLAFADFFLENEIKALSDMRDAPVKKLSCFTGTQTDQNKLCINDKYKLQQVVFRKYIGCGNSTISDQRKKFKELLQKIDRTFIS